MGTDEIVVHIIVTSSVISIIVSLICGKIIAIHTFNVIDGYVREVIEMAKKSIRDARTNK